MILRNRKWASLGAAFFLQLFFNVEIAAMTVPALRPCSHALQTYLMSPERAPPPRLRSSYYGSAGKRANLRPQPALLHTFCTPFYFFLSFPTHCCTCSVLNEYSHTHARTHASRDNAYITPSPDFIHPVRSDNKVRARGGSAG